MREIRNAKNELIVTIKLAENATDEDYKKAANGMGYELDGSKIILAQEATATSSDKIKELQAQLDELKQLTQGE